MARRAARSAAVPGADALIRLEAFSRGTVRRLVASGLLAVALLPPIWLRADVPVRPMEDVTATLLALDLPATRQGFTREAVWHVESASPLFGGYSAMLPLGGKMLRLFSDRGTRLTLGVEGNMLGPRAGKRSFARVWDIGPFSGHHPDIESATRDPVSGDYWLGFESFNGIARYGVGSDFQAVWLPREMENWPVNGGIEAMVRLADGRFLALPEHRAPGLLFSGDPTRATAAMPFRFALPDPYYATDMAQLPDGRLLVLTRGLRLGLPPFTARLYLGDPALIEEAGELALTEVLDLDTLVPRENWEALAVTRADDGSLAVWIASDDNLAALQRTLVARLRWIPVLR